MPVHSVHRTHNASGHVRRRGCPRGAARGLADGRAERRRYRERRGDAGAGGANRRFCTLTMLVVALQTLFDSSSSESDEYCITMYMFRSTNM